MLPRIAPLSLAMLTIVFSTSCAVSTPPERALAASQVIAARLKAGPLERAFVQLASGSPRQAATQFRAVLNSGADPHYGEYNEALGGVFLADLYAQNDRAAAADISLAVANAGGAPAGDRAAARGLWSSAWSQYLHESEPANAACTDATVAQGIRFAMVRRFSEARSAWREREQDVGKCDVAWEPFLFANGEDTKSALLGLSYLQEGRWRDAEAALIVGVMLHRATSGYTKPFPGNIIAMQMLFAYRAHFRRGQGRYRWPDLEFPAD